MELPSSIDPSCLPCIDPSDTAEVVVELVKCEAPEDPFLGIHKLDVENSVFVAIPDLVILEKTQGPFFSYFNIEQGTGGLVGEGDQVLIAQEGEETDQQGNEKEGKSNPIETDPSRFQGGDLAVARERPQGKKGRQKNRIRKSPLKSHFGDLVEEVFEDQIERGLISDEEVQLLQEENNHVDEDEAAQAQAENPEILAGNISAKDSMPIEHSRKAFSIYAGETRSRRSTTLPV